MTIVVVRVRAGQYRTSWEHELFAESKALEFVGNTCCRLQSDSHHLVQVLMLEWISFHESRLELVIKTR